MLNCGQEQQKTQKQMCKQDKLNSNKVIFEYNNNKTNYPSEKTIHELFEEQSLKTPDNIAVSYGKSDLSYRQLNKYSNQLAKRLKSMGVKKEDAVAVIINPCNELIIATLAILKSGCAYLPINNTYPSKRIEYMLNDAKVKIIITISYLMDKIDFKGEVICIDDFAFSEHEESTIENINKSSDLAYIMYTSGSTGNPKGVLIEHRGVNRLVKNTNYITFLESDRILLTGSISFDASTFEIWGALLNGLRLYLTDKRIILDSDMLYEFLVKNEISILWLTSQLFNYHVQNNPRVFSNLRTLLIGGDVLSTYYVNKVREVCEGINIINGYGPTENTTFSTCYLIKSKFESSIPIGKPISNSTAYILDDKLNLLPVGEVGELFVGGDGLARGYLNNQDLTDERFIGNPYVPNEKLYRTGDLARWLQDGNLEFIGRSDNQIKIRGFRIEPREIEMNLSKHELIRQAVVISINGEDNRKYLCAYYLSDHNLQAGDIHDFLSGLLPDFMIPSYFVKVDTFPITENGKINKDKLPIPPLSSYDLKINENMPIKSFDGNDKLACEIKKIIKDNIEFDFLTNDMVTSSFIKDLGINSFLFMDIVIAIEAKYNIIFDENYLDFKSFQTVGDLISYVRKCCCGLQL